MMQAPIWRVDGMLLAAIYAERVIIIIKPQVALSTPQIPRILQIMTFRVIVVGGGLAGLTLASALEVHMTFT